MTDRKMKDSDPPDSYPPDSEPADSDAPDSDAPDSNPPDSEPSRAESGAPDSGRRGFLARASGTAMGVSLVAGYGTFGAMAVRYLYPPHDRPTTWLYVIDVAGMAPGSSRKFTAPDGSRIAIARQGEGGSVDDFIALSSVCPHLGCQVKWQGQRDRFFCPCHNGVFDKTGKATEGPPAQAKQSLARYPLEVRDGLLFIEVPA